MLKSQWVEWQLICCLSISQLKLESTPFDMLILRKIIKTVATTCQILRLKCTKFDFGWGSAPDPAGSLQRSPRPSSCDALLLRGREGMRSRTSSILLWPLFFDIVFVDCLHCFYACCYCVIPQRGRISFCFPCVGLSALSVRQCHTCLSNWRMKTWIF